MTSKQLKAAAESTPPVADGLPPSIHPQVFQHTVNQADMAISITDVQGIRTVRDTSPPPAFPHTSRRGRARPGWR